ncbi:MAG: hypothetical protein WB780_02780 [Candidatus Acidiferrales bacterium]
MPRPEGETMNESNDLLIPGTDNLKEPGRAMRRPEVYKVFDSAYNELNQRRGIIENGGDSEQAREAKEEILYFAHLFKTNKMLDYIAKIFPSENPPDS